MRILVGKRSNHITESRKRFIDMLCFFQSISSHLRLVNSFTSCQIYQMHTATENGSRCQISSLNMNRQATTKNYSIEVSLVHSEAYTTQYHKDISINHLWERLLRSFRAVAPTARFLWPRFIRLMTSEVDDTLTRLASGTLRPF